MILEHEPRKIAINPDRFDKLITALRTAVDNDGTLDKEATSYNDIFDAFRLALKFYSFRDSSEYDWHKSYFGIESRNYRITRRIVARTNLTVFSIIFFS